VKKGAPRRLWLKGPNRDDNVYDAVLFESGGDGHYYSDCGRFAIFHMMRSTPHVCWELHQIDPERRSIDLVEGNAITLSDLVTRYARGDFSLPEEEDADG